MTPLMALYVLKVMVDDCMLGFVSIFEWMGQGVERQGTVNKEDGSSSSKFLGVDWCHSIGNRVCRLLCDLMLYSSHDDTTTATWAYIGHDILASVPSNEFWSDESDHGAW
eukprot:scaffold521716_cov75-Attheya_sp.AAC.2